ncbi:MAG: glycosyltransferase [Lachnospiraceae bacterium]|nr:glycosyltransferase [Lachnospiraceae bacterium]
MKKTLRYLKRNGLRDTYAAARERLHTQPYTYEPPSEQILLAQRKKTWSNPPFFSIVVPMYRTPERFCREMVESVLSQTYPHFELLLIDASETESTQDDSSQGKSPAAQYADTDARIRYLKLPRNLGISGNTNVGIQKAKGEYIGLLDHDDVLTPDALYEMATAIDNAYRHGTQALLLYSDEDKCLWKARKESFGHVEDSQNAYRYIEPHQKTDFNLDLLLSNNYICHFLMIEADLIKRNPLRKEFDGAQDFELILSCVSEILGESLELRQESAIIHIPRILYHWRAHEESTAQDPMSKYYAYEAGQRSLRNFIQTRGFFATVEMHKHLGFYRIVYQTDLFANRPDIGALGGKLIKGKAVIGGCYDQEGRNLYQGLRIRESGYLHRASLQQDAYAVDIRCVKINPKCQKLFEKVIGVPYRETPDKSRFDDAALPATADHSALSIQLGKALQNGGYRILWNPQWIRALPWYK